MIDQVAGLDEALGFGQIDPCGHPLGFVIGETQILQAISGILPAAGEDGSGHLHSPICESNYKNYTALAEQERLYSEAGAISTCEKHATWKFDVSISYRLDANGNLELRGETGCLIQLIPHDGEFAFLRDGYVLHKHGEAKGIRVRCDHMQAQFAAIGGDISELEVLSVKVSALDETRLDVINRCLAISGYVGRIDGNFRADIDRQHPEMQTMF